MTCHRPYTAYRAVNGVTKTGKHRITFKKSQGLVGTEMKVACGQCYGCRLEKSRVWAMRCMHESKMHKDNYFLTLTYNDENLPEKESLVKRHLQLFFKKVRKKYDFRYYACGEYGDKSSRPHYHVIMFGLRIDDLRYYSGSGSGRLYTSSYLEKEWSHGFVTIGSVTFESCAYVARYVMKKWRAKTKEEFEKHYERVDKETGELYSVEPEFQVMSRRPGIGTEFYNKYKRDMYQFGSDGQVVVRAGVQGQTPRFYDNKYENESTCRFKKIQRIKKGRRKKAEERASDNTEARLNVKENIAMRIAKKRLPRTLN